MAGWHHWLDGHEFEWTTGIGDGQGGLACCDSWGRKESDTTEWLIWSHLIPSPSDLPNPGMELGSPALQTDFFFYQLSYQGSIVTSKNDNYLHGDGLVAKSCPTLCHPMEPTRLLCPWDFPGKNTGVDCHFVLQRIFLTQGLNSHLLYCRQIRYGWATWEAQLPSLTHKTVFRYSDDNYVITKDWFHCIYHFQEAYHSYF